MKEVELPCEINSDLEQFINSVQYVLDKKMKRENILPSFNKIYDRQRIKVDFLNSQMKLRILKIYRNHRRLPQRGYHAEGYIFAAGN